MAHKPEHPSPTILFDGVCNLCNATVAWVIRHDRHDVFRFASLQSDAGRSILVEANALRDAPDSIVLVDDSGVQTRSDAVIGIGRRLGFPWSLAMLALPVPRAMRDRVYSWVARNRYRWFGRRESCLIPSPDLCARFLDAAKIAPESTLPPTLIPTNSNESFLFSRFSLRLILAYFFVYIIPFPLNIVPGLDPLMSTWTSPWQSIVQWIGQHILGVNASILPGGSGDTTYNYVETLVDVGMAVILATCWSLLAKSRPVSARVLDLSRTYGRYFLGATMLNYGWHKAMPNQFPIPGPDRLLMPYGDSSPMGLLWTFMGASPAYQMLAGVGEVLGGLFLLWRRTTLLGALISAGILANIVAMNFCYDVPVKLFSLHLFLLAAIVIAPDVVRLLGVLLFNLPVQPTAYSPFPIQRTWVRRSAMIVRLAVIGLIAVYPAFENYQSLKTYGLLAPRTAMHGVYRVDSFVRDNVAGKDNAFDALWVRVAINEGGLGAIQRADGTARRFRLAIDREKRTLTLTRREDPNPTTLNFTLSEPGILRVEGVFEGAPTVAVLHKIEDDASILTSRGFHWVNEYPFNR